MFWFIWNQYLYPALKNITVQQIPSINTLKPTPLSSGVRLQSAKHWHRDEWPLIQYKAEHGILAIFHQIFWIDIKSDTSIVISLCITETVTALAPPAQHNVLNGNKCMHSAIQTCKVQK